MRSWPILEIMTQSRHSICHDGKEVSQLDATITVY